MPREARDAARLLALITPAGPRASRTAAHGVVARLRRGVRWADERLGPLTGLDEAAARVRASRTLVVDRHGAMAVVARGLDARADRRGPSYAASAGLVLRAVAAEATALWDPAAPGRILVAPNVLSAAHDDALDLSDWCAWTALRAGLLGVHLEHAPHLVRRLARGAARLPEGLDDLLRLVLLLDALADAEMSVLTPADLPSVRWLRTHRAGADPRAALRALAPRLDPSAADALRLDASRFASEALAHDLLPRLLDSPGTWPTAAEYADPTAWRARVS
ncbi:hypothetical protein [Actinomyces sp. B33]|uniref:hypothetical protein n=1 Tax=Actinomyces sp. B33 TaxID=2942131 RepID=UPI002340279E|nr:hypothetical protein [Actinomyces sp. B33]